MGKSHLEERESGWTRKWIVVARQREEPWEIRAQESKGKQLAFLQTHSAAWGQARKSPGWL